MTNSYGDLQLVSKAADRAGTRSDFELIVRLADKMGHPAKQLVPFGRKNSGLVGLRADLGQTRGAQSGEADRHAVWLQANGLEPKVSPFDPFAILDEIQRLVPGYDKLLRLQLLSGNDSASRPRPHRPHPDRRCRHPQGPLPPLQRHPLHLRLADEILTHAPKRPATPTHRSGRSSSAPPTDMADPNSTLRSARVKLFVHKALFCVVCFSSQVPLVSAPSQTAKGAESSTRGAVDSQGDPIYHSLTPDQGGPQRRRASYTACSVSDQGDKGEVSA